MNYLILIFKGFFIGIGKIIPGVSGSLIAITLGVYDRLLESISHFYKKENIKFLVPLGVGIIVAIMLTSNLLTYLLDCYYVIVMLFFIGLIMGGTSITKTSFKGKNIFCFLVSFLLVFSLCFVKSDVGVVKDYSFFVMVLIGLIEAITMVIPGISGTAIMMIIGCYATVLNMFSNPISNLSLLIPFCIGTFIGVLIISKILSFLFKKYKDGVKASILGFTISSIFLLIIKVFESKDNILIGLPFLIIGILLGYITEKK